MATLTDTLTDRFRTVPLVTPSWGFPRSASDTVGIAPTQTVSWRLDALLDEYAAVADAHTVKATYGQVLTDLTRIAERLSAGRPVTLSEGVGVASALTTVFGALLLERLGLARVVAPSIKYGQTLSDRLRTADALRRFIGADLAQTIGVASTLTPAYRALRTLTQGLGVADAITPRLLIRLTLADGVRLTDASLVKLILKPTLRDGIEIVAGYVSPNGTFTTWAVNTRTGAVTEYGNYAFNSYAQISPTSYLAASSTGLYELQGDDDQGTDIIAKIKSGWAQFGGSRYTSLQTAYMGVRGDGDVFLKIVAGTGETYTYQAKLQDQQTTRVRIGKGLRARYFSFELISTGQDFDLDQIEFVPIVAQRRV